MDDSKLSVRINIADRIYPLRIARHNEEKLRRAARMINDDLAQYKDYTDRDTQDTLAISALQFVIRLIESEEKTKESPLLAELIELDGQLDSYLKDKKDKKI